jgi:long-chain acyl-CoA synthetase
VSSRRRIWPRISRQCDPGRKLTSNLAANLVDSARDHGDNVAIRLDRSVVTYAELERLSRQVACLLADYSVAAGDRVAVMLSNVPEFAALYDGILRIGAVKCR